MEIKKYYYIQIIKNKKLRFITNSKLESEEEQAPYEFDSKEVADNVALKLCLNRTYAFVFESIYPISSKNKKLF